MILFVSYDVTSCLTNIQFEELLIAVEKVYDKFDKNVYSLQAPSTSDLSY